MIGEEIRDIDWESVGNFILFGTLVFLGSVVVGAIVGLIVR